MSKKTLTKQPLEFIEILKLAYEEGGTVQIPYEIKDNKVVDLDFFQLLDNLGDDEPITLKSKTKTKMILEIENSGIGKMIDAYEKLQSQT